MVEQGIVTLVQAAITASPVSLTVPGGFFAELPKDQVSPASPMAWTYKTIMSTPEYILQGPTGWTDWHVQIDCHGNAASDSITLARAIDNVLHGSFHGALPDPDATYVFGMYNSGPSVDGFSDANRTYVRSLEYVIQYQQI